MNFVLPWKLQLMNDKKMDTSEHNFLEDTTFSSFAPLATSSAVRDAQENTFMKVENFTGVLPNLFISQQDLPAEDQTFVKDYKTKENHNNVHEQQSENSSLGLLPLDNLNEMNGSVISIESGRKIMDTEKKLQKAKSDLVDVHPKKANLLRTDKKVTSNEFTAETTLKLQDDNQRWCDSKNDNLTVKKYKQYNLYLDSHGSTEVDDRKNRSTDQVCEITEAELHLSTEQEAVKYSVTIQASDENTLNSTNGTPLASVISSKYFQPASHLSSEEESSLTLIGFPMNNSTEKESLPIGFHGSKVSDEVEFTKANIAYRSSSFDTYRINFKDGGVNQNTSLPAHLMPDSSVTPNAFDILDNSSIPVNLYSLSSYLHSTRNISQESKPGKQNETSAVISESTVSKQIVDVQEKDAIDGKNNKKCAVVNNPLIYCDENGEFVTDLAFRIDFRKEIQNDGTGDTNFGEFFTADEVEKMLLEDEKEFHKDHLFEIENVENQTVLSIASSWMPAAQDITRPSWMSSESNNNTHSRISIGQFMRGRTETLGTLEGSDENRPSFGIKGLSAPNESNTNASYTPDNVSMKETDKGKYMPSSYNSNETESLSSSESESHRLLRSCSDLEKDSTSSLLSVGSISKLISEMSISDDTQAAAAKLLANIHTKKSKQKLTKEKVIRSSSLPQTQRMSSGDNLDQIQIYQKMPQDSEIHSDLQKLSSEQDTSPQSSSNESDFQTVIRARSFSKHEKAMNSRKCLFSSTDKKLYEKNLHSLYHKPAATKMRKSSSTQELVTSDDADQPIVHAMKNHAASETDLSKMATQELSNVSQLHIYKNRSEHSSEPAEIKSAKTKKLENITVPCHSASVPNLLSQTFPLIKNNQNFSTSCSSQSCEGNYELGNIPVHSVNNVPLSISQPVCSVSIAPCSFLASNQIISQNPSVSCAMPSVPPVHHFPLQYSYVTSFQPLHSVTGVPTVISNASHMSCRSTNCCHGILLEAKEKQGFAGNCALLCDHEPIHQLSSNIGNLQNASLRKTLELNISEPMCIGDTTQFALVLQNPTSSPLLCILKVNVSIDGQILPAAVVSGFSFPHHLQIEANGTKQVQILYTPRQCGHVAALLEVNVDTAAPILGYPLTAVINAQVEWPQVLLAVDGSNDIGAMEECHVAKRIITVTNHSKVAVPVRLYISEYIQCSHSFSFGVQEINTEANKDNIVWHFISPKVLVFKLPGKKMDAATKLEIPLFFQTGKVKQGNNEEVSAIINATLESSVMCKALGSVKLSAVIGLVRLSVKAATQGALTFEAKPKCEVEKQIILQNNGSVLCRFNLDFNSNNSCFQVFPNYVELDVGEKTTVRVTFYSDHKCNQENVLQAILENGKIHQLLAVRGECKRKHERKVTIIRRHPRSSRTENCQIQLTSNKSYISWAGVDIGQTVEEKLVLRNSSATQSLFLKLILKGNVTGIKLDQHLTLNPELHMKPEEEATVKLTFSPTDTCVVNGTLLIQPVEASISDMQYAFPLIGYSGASKIIVEDVNRRADGSYFLNMCLPSYQNTAVSHFRISNVGRRTGYINVLYFTDYNLVEKTTSVVTSPSEFVLHPKETKTLVVACNHADFVQSSSSSLMQIAVLAIFYGDEILRQKLKRALKNNGIQDCIPPGPLCDINFTLKYSGEKETSFDGSFPDSLRDVEIFYSNISRYLIGLDLPSEDSICDSTNNTMTSFARDSVVGIFNNTFDNTEEREKVGNNVPSPPVKGSSSHPHNTVDNLSLASVDTKPYHHCYDPSTSILNKENISGNEDSNKLEMWRVEPTALNIGTEGKEGRICLTNLSNSDLRFKLQWTSNVLCVSPVQGVLLAGGSLGLRVTPVVSSPSVSLKEKNVGFVKVFCGGQQKEIPVNLQSCRLPLNHKKSTLPKEKASSQHSQRKPMKHVNKKIFKALGTSSIICPEEVRLEDAVVGGSSETTFQIRNCASKPMKWNIAPVSDVVVQSENQQNVNAASDLTISMKQNTGLLGANCVKDIVAKFEPSVPGIHLQQWELNTESKEQIYINISGQGYESTVLPSFIEGSETSRSMHSWISNVTSSRGSFFQPLSTSTSTLQFSAIGLKRVMLKLKLMNKSDVDHKISVVKPSPPFFVKHANLIVKNKHYLSLPVHFIPKSEGNFSGKLFLQTELGYDIKINLVGEAKSS